MIANFHHLMAPARLTVNPVWGGQVGALGVDHPGGSLGNQLPSRNDWALVKVAGKIASLASGGYTNCIFAVTMLYSHLRIVAAFALGTGQKVAGHACFVLPDVRN